MITARMIGQFGNQLFTYVVCKILAERTGLAYSPPIEFVNKRGQPVVWSELPAIVMAPTAGRVLSERKLEGEHVQRICCDHWFDFSSLRSDRPIHIEQGYFQNYSLLVGWKQKMRRDWLAIWGRLPRSDPVAVYLHCRRTDYVPGVDNPNDPSRCCLAATLDDYAACLKEFPDAKRLVVVTDDPGDPFMQEFPKLGLPWAISGLPWDQDWRLLLAAENLVICQSTFSWWAGWLGRAWKIVCPLPKGSFLHPGLGGRRSRFACLPWHPSEPPANYPNPYPDLYPFHA